LDGQMNHIPMLDDLAATSETNSTYQDNGVDYPTIVSREHSRLRSI